MSRVPCAFYAPMKPPDHPNPSGDRTMARLLIAALDEAGFRPEIASRLRSHDPAGDADRQQALAADGRGEAARLAARYLALPPALRPRLWFTYHCYYKAPDHLGPAVARALGCPYVVAEASRAAKRHDGPWAAGHAAAEAAIDAADLLFVMTAQDREALARRRPAGQRLVDLPPFIEAGPAPLTERRPGGPTRLLAVAMMRPGDKLASYDQLSQALALLPAKTWTLDIVGDGPARPEVERLFASFGPQVAFAGRLDGDALAERYGAADLFVWPSVNEAYGMALLEAQTAGCPVVAGAYGGVADAMRPGTTGMMVPPGDVPAFAGAIAALMADETLRLRLGAAARRFVTAERTVSAAAGILRASLLPMVGAKAA